MLAVNHLMPASSRCRSWPMTHAWHNQQPAQRQQPACMPARVLVRPHVPQASPPAAAAASSAGTSGEEPHSVLHAEASHAASTQSGVPSPASGAGATQQTPGLWQRIKTFVVGDKGITKERLAALGLGAFAAYGVISNINAGCLVTVAWLTVVKTQGVTPLAPGMWPKFLGVYAGLWVSSHFMRPIRLSLALAVAPSFNAALDSLSARTRLPKPAAFGIMLVGIAAASIGFLLSALWVCGGFPPAPAPALAA